MDAVPVISVVMPVFNGGRYLAEAIESILRQTERHFELLVIDDGSTDNSAEIAGRYAQQDSRVNLVRLQHCGLAGACNEGIRLARGEFIARMDADDIAAETRFEHQLGHLRDHPNCIAVGGAIVDLRPDGSKGRLHDYWVAHSEYDPDGLPQDIGIAHPAALIRTAAIRSVDGYRAAFRHSEDSDLWRRLIEIGHLDNLPTIVLFYRRNPDGVSVRFAAEQALGDAFARVLSVARASGGEPDWDSSVALSPATIGKIADMMAPYPSALIYIALAGYHYSNGDFRSAEQNFSLALRRDADLARSQATFDKLWKPSLRLLLRRGRWRVPVRLLSYRIRRLPHAIIQSGSAGLTKRDAKHRE